MNPEETVRHPADNQFRRVVPTINGSRTRRLVRVARSGQGRQVLGLTLIAVISLAAGVGALTDVDPGRIGALGVIEAVPPIYFVSLGLSLVGFVASLGLSRPVPALLGLQLLVLITILHGADPIIHHLPRLEASYRHLGIADYIANSGELDPKIDAYFNWPGFFSLMAMFSQATGLHDLTGIATWAPLGVNVLLLPPLLALATKLTSNWRQTWASVWVFYLASWVGQDYLSPQAFTFLLMVTLIAALLAAFGGWARPMAATRVAGRWRAFVGWLDVTSVERSPGIMLAPGVRALLATACATIALVMTASHQLTPFALLTILVAFDVAGIIRIRFLVVLAVVLPALWLAVVAAPYWTGHLTEIFGSIGSIGTTTTNAFTSRLGGSDPHMIIVAARLAETGLVAALAIIGAVVGRRRRLPWLTAALGATAPLGLVLVQPYGGELLLRLYLFGLPFAAPLVVLPLIPKTQGRPRWGNNIALLLLGALLATTTLVTRYGNDKMENFTADEIQITNHLYKLAPAGSVVIEALHNTPWRFRQYDGYSYETLLPAKAQASITRLSCDTVDRLAKKAGAFLMVTQSQKDAAETLGVGPAGSIDTFIATCSQDAGWSVVYQNAGGVIYHIEGVTHGK